MPLRKLKIIEAALLPQKGDGTYTVSYTFEDAVRGADMGLTLKEAEKRAARVGEYELMIDEEDAD